MIKFQAEIKRFSSQGEKTGWTYIEIPLEMAQQMKPGNKKSFRVKGSFDDFSFKGVSLLPMGKGNFIIPFNASMRKGTGKRRGSQLTVAMEPDNVPVTFNDDLMKCLADEPEAYSFFNTLAPGHKKYFSNWVESAKTEQTRATRIAHTVNAMIRRMDFSTMSREIKIQRQFLSGGS